MTIKSRAGKEMLCTNCGKSCYVSQSRAKRFRYCSKECFNEAQTGERKKINCEKCGNEFLAKKDHGSWQKYCSRKCFDRFNGTDKNKECPTCGNHFVAGYSSHTDDGLNKYCSVSCAGIGIRNKKLVVCVSCGKCFEISKSKKEKYKTVVYCCSKECSKRYRRLANSTSWKGGGFAREDGERFVAEVYQKTIKKYVGEHRVIAQMCVRRKLRSNEIVLRINNKKTDNRKDNLFICSREDFCRYRSGILSWPVKSNLDYYT